MIKVQQALIRYEYDDILDVATAAIPWERLSGKTILITEADGLIGFYLTTALLLRNDLYNEEINVIALVTDDIKARKRFGDLLIRDDLDLAVQDTYRELKINQRADFIICSADNSAKYNSPVAVLDSVFSSTINVLSYAEKCMAESTLMVSDLKVYGVLHNGKDSINETDIGYLDHTDYKNCCAIGKRASENISSCCCKQTGLSVKIARPSYIYGPVSLEDDRDWAKIIANIVRGEDILLESDAATSSPRSFCYVTDAVEALFTILLCGADAYPYNISSEYSNVSIRDFAKTAVETFSDMGVKLRFSNHEDERESQRSYLGSTPEILDNKRLKDLGWVGRTTLREGISRAVRIVLAQN